ncbi:DeoR family transcriptional regulator [Homoserinimonas aerilata]|uniref:Lactose phosphotransferase system repressor n=1 Tax=Homoserinimonas aerilata TaxID=1162970 RepID=A0A542YGK3_9MICO|nr:DeoR/GlpR family DNA-binding transcription regulator [Homoserinimonas aerilata]TQL47223.1 DeoR family transcriptional regulator [Homoserinimonas aerilata]
MYAEERQQLIVTRLEAAGRVSVAPLASEFDVSNETIRRDLDQLEAKGLARRVHGGAVPVSRISLAEESIDSRRMLNTGAKERIARAAMAFIPGSFSGAVAIDAGSTTGLFAHTLSQWTPDAPQQSIVVITNSILIAQAVNTNPHVEVQLIGGRLRTITSAAVGPTALAQLAGLRPDVAFIGANGVHAEFGFSTPDADEAAVKSALTHGARRAVALVDASKLGGETLVSFAALGDVDTLVTDGAPDAELTQALQESDVETVIA